MYSVVIPCAGSGTRAKLGYNKMLFKINGKTIIEHTANVFINNPMFNQVIVVVSENDYTQVNSMFTDPQVLVTIGGKERMNSVHLGVLHAQSEFVFIHDGARMFIDDLLIDRLVNELSSEVDGCALAVEVVDTILQIENNKIIKVLNRDKLRGMQTPQVVGKASYLKSYKQAQMDNLTFTDEMSLLTHYGYHCTVVAGAGYNLKLTNPEDFQGEICINENCN